MLEKLDNILNFIIGGLLGAFTGHAIYQFWNYKAHPDQYAAQSAPWYTSILAVGVVLAALLLLAVVVKLIVRRRLRQQ